MIQLTNKIKIIKFLVCIKFILFNISPVFAEENQDGTYLKILTDSETYIFKIKLADNKSKRELGMQGKKSLGKREGMLFDFKASKVVNMWMKNTSIPLDMLFIRSDGVIDEIITNTTPFSLKVITSKNKVSAVLEINGGTTKKLKIKRGNHIKHNMFR